MPKVFHCSKCQNEHEQPVGKKCQVKLTGESFSSTSEVAASSSTSDITAVSDQILSKLQQIGEQMELMDRRVQRTEAALEQGSPLPSTSRSQHGTATVSNHSITIPDSNSSVVVDLKGDRQRHTSNTVNVKKQQQTVNKGKNLVHLFAGGAMPELLHKSE